MSKVSLHNLFGTHAAPLPGVEFALIEEQIEALGDALNSSQGDEFAREFLERNQEDIQFLAAAMQISPYLRANLLKFPDLLVALEQSAIDQVIADLTQQLRNLWREQAIVESKFMAQLRVLKRKIHTLIAIADLSRHYQMQQATQALSTMAGAAIQSTINFLLLDLIKRGKVQPDCSDNPSHNSGLIVLAMGKLGASELNYSSDVDLIFFFDEATGFLTNPAEGTDHFTRLARRFVRVLGERTEHGYGLRVDLRLRPDPGATPLAIPVEAAANYYASRGQNWERAALIKARPIGGDIVAGEAFLNEITPFIWRKYLDYAAIADIHSIKRQIHAHKGFSRPAVRGHNIKLGRGGIREIEFFVQTQQLIAGGRTPQLRCRQTREGLQQLASHNWISQDTAQTLDAAYVLYRDIENRIQMTNDSQTHTIAAEDDQFAQIAQLMGYAEPIEFEADVQQALGRVSIIYAALFESEPALSSDVGSLVFTGENDDPETLSTLNQLGYQRPADISRLLRQWHNGRYPATQSTKARERLTEVTPKLLSAFAESGNGDDVAIAFDRFLSGLPSGIQFFSLMKENPRLLDLLLTVLAAAPRLAAIITKRPHVFDGLLNPAVFAKLPSQDEVQLALDYFLAGVSNYEDQLNRLRLFAAEQKFLIGIRLLTSVIDADEAALAYTNLAETLIGQALELAKAEFEVKHGTVPGGRSVLLGMGKLGSRELAADSDLDLILIYDHSSDAVASDGDKPLDPVTYFGRLTQRFVAAVSAPMGEGVLYELDLRLRPSGNKGPIATHIEAFAKYQQNNAWTWEHMALTRARSVAGDASLAEQVGAVCEGVLKRPREEAELIEQIREMRIRVAEQKPPASDLDVKLMAGGLIDLEFIAQFSVLAQALPYPPTGTRQVLAMFAECHLTPAAALELVRAHELYQTFTQLNRLSVGEIAEGPGLAPALQEIHCAQSNLPSFETFVAHLHETARLVRNHFNTIFQLDGKDG